MAKAALALMFALAPLACDEDSSNSQPAGSAEPETTMHFNVDPALIGQMRRFEGFNVQIAPPADWTSVPHDQVAAIGGALADGGPATQPTTQSSPLFKTEPLAAFSNADAGLWLVVSAVEAPDAATYEAALRQYRKLQSATSYKVAGIEVHQYVVHLPGTVNFKLLLDSPGRADSRRLQLDYIMPLQTYRDHSRRLESSLGSMRPLGRNGA